MLLVGESQNKYANIFSRLSNTMDAIVSLARSVPAMFPKRELTSLSIGEPYHILAMRLINTRFGRTIVADLEEFSECSQGQDNIFFIYLPKRWSEVYTEDQLKSIQPCKLSLRVTGHTPLANEKISVQLTIEHVRTKILYFYSNSLEQLFLYMILTNFFSNFSFSDEVSTGHTHIIIIIIKCKKIMISILLYIFYLRL